VLAVEMHQVTNDSTDLSFDLELIGLPVSNWPRLEISRAGSGVRLGWPAAAAAYALESAAAPGSETGWLPANVPLATNSLHIQTIIPRDGARQFFRLRR
jgi:hypothetical protein